MIGDSTWRFLVFDVLLNNRYRSTATRSGKVARRPKHAFPIMPFEFRESSAQMPRRYSLKAINQLGDCQFGRVMYQEMDMVGFAIKFYQFGLEIPANFCEYILHSFQNRGSEDFFAVLGNKYEVHMQVKNAMPSGADIR